MILFSGKIYYCTHEDNRKPDQFQDFCKKFLPGHTVERMSCGTDKKQIVLVLSVPTKGRLNPYDYFSGRVKDTVQTYELNKPGKTYCYFLLRIMIPLYFSEHIVCICILLINYRQENSSMQQINALFLKLVDSSSVLSILWYFSSLKACWSLALL